MLSDLEKFQECHGRWPAAVLPTYSGLSEACLQELRLTAAGQFDMHRKLEEAGCSVVFGQPQEELTNPWHCNQGGVAIVARAGLTLQAATAACNLEKCLLDTRRYVHAAFAPGGGKRVAHVMCVWF